MDAVNFDKLVLSPGGVAHAGLAIAAARAGGIGLIDLAFCADPAAAVDNIRELVRATARGGRIGLRLPLAQRAALPDLLALADDRGFELVLCGEAAAVNAWAADLRAADTPGIARIYAELTLADEAAQLGAAVDALIACGQEAAGWVGEDSSFLQAQKLLAGSTRPVLLRGGFGLHGAAALALSGAAGVVLDDQVLLLRESFLDADQQAPLARLDGSETRLYGIDGGCRLFAPRGSAAGRQAEALARQFEAGELTPAGWREALAALSGWGDGQLWPLGQAVGLAADYRQRYGRVGKLLQAIDRQRSETADALAAGSPLAPGAPLAAAHGTRYPLVQGPMTRVSDSPAFARAVADGGALPFLALALMRAEQVEVLLAETRAQMDGRPWGVGILGFVPQALRDEQCEVLFRHQPDYALIAGGRPDQAADFERRGIPAYLHAPAPALLRLYLEQGARRFVFEGRECGGHIGPLASFALWEQMVELLLAEVDAETAPQMQLLFAGGIGDAESAAMVAALTAPLAARGMKVGVLMGTAYLFTDAIVTSGAVVPGFQQEALACARTRHLETGPGHATRCADTAFAAEFSRRRRELLAAGGPAEQLRDALEDLNLGRLRVASKGRDRNAAGELVEVDADTQHRDGMYMIGQVATRQSRVQSIAELHHDVSQHSGELLAARLAARSDSTPGAAPSDIAVIGIGMILPQADSAEAFWGHVLKQHSTITEVPKERWDQALYFDPDKSARDKVYAKWGGFLDEVVFDPVSFGIAPSSMKSIDPMQLLSLEVTARALRDAELGDDFDRENTSIILGAGGGIGDLGMQLGVRAELPRFVQNPDDAAWDRLPEWTNESFAGVLLNVSAGRVANRLDFGGVNFTVDAACGSSLAAITLATQELESGRSNVAVAGGVDTVQGPFGYLCFAKTQALSPNGRARVFDRDADGIVISEGVCVVVMKRLADAERDGDRIYATIKAAAGSSDGRALGMTAPLPRGQMRALNRAYKKAGFSPATLGLVEAHGTGTPVGDRAEAETIVQTLGAAGAEPASVALGSVKSLIGHTKCAAGVTGLVKTALALHHRVLPGHSGVERPLDVIADPASPVTLLREPRPWLGRPGAPRRAAVSAFGFGGTNFHAVLEEYRPGWGADAAPGADDWPAELFLLRAPDAEALAAQASDMARALDQPGPLRLAELAYGCARAAEEAAPGGACAAFVARDRDELRGHLDALARGDEPAVGRHWTARLPDAPPKVAVLFPGQGAQSLHMGREAALYLEPLRAAVEQADAMLAERLGTSLSNVMWPPSVYTPEREAEQRERLTDTRHAQPALGALELGYWQWLAGLGLAPTAAAGHSYGEYAALMAAGVLAPEDFLTLSAQRGQAMAAAAGREPAGTMAVISASREQVEALLADLEEVSVANDNAPQQVVITGTVAAVDNALAAAERAGYSAQRLPVSGAFHSPLMCAAQEELSAAIDAVAFAEARFPVYANRSGGLYPQDDPAGELKQHLLSPVEFQRQIRGMRADGIELFVELGPKATLCGLMGRILDDPTARCIAVEPAGQGLAGPLNALAELLVAGVPLDVAALFRGRRLQPLPLDELQARLARQPLPRTAWFVAGGYARAQDSEVRGNGRLPALDAVAKSAASEPASAGGPASGVAMAPAIATLPETASPPAAAGGLGAEAFAAYQQTMRQFLALQEQVMRQALGGTASAPETTPAVAPTVAGAPAANRGDEPAPAPDATSASSPKPAPRPAAEPNWDAARLTALLTTLTAERTGYPEDMLDPDADLEADLGVDSIKRVELVGALQKRLPAPLAEAMRDSLEQYTRARSLRAIVEPLAALAVEAPTAEAAPAAAGESAAPGADLRAELLALVAERTGYPEDMLDADANLEADLGVDSIKRVEIVGALQKRLPAAVSAAMQENLEHYTRAATLSELLARIEALAAEAAGAAGGETPAPSADPGATAMPDLRAELLALVAERTGYPEDMLDADANLEADLGVDSIKRVEIVGALQKRLPAAVSAAMQENLEHYTRAATLNELQARIEALSSAPDAAPGPGSAPEPDVHAAPAAARETPTPAAEHAIDAASLADAEPLPPRYVVRPQELPSAAPGAAPQGLVLVAGGPEAIREPLAERLRAAGVEVVEWLLDGSEDLAGELRLAQQSHGQVEALVYLEGLVPRAEDDAAAFRAAGGAVVGQLFVLLQALGRDAGALRLLAATRLGGTLGREASGPGPLVAGGLTGLLNCFRAEQPDARASVVDFNGQSDASIAERLYAELCCAEAPPEVGYLGDTRYGAATQPAPLKDTAFAPHLEPQPDWLVLATGGARGITPDILLALAKPGMRCVLLGRTPEPRDEDLLPEHADEAALKTALLEAARARGERPRPVELDRELDRIRASRELKANLERLRAAGLEVRYLPCDVRDAAALGRLIDDLYAEYGRIDGVIHAAGIIEDKLIVDKGRESFRRVFGTKTEAAATLARHLRPEGLRWCAFFSSVAGRYGNAGQADYAAANELLNRQAWELSRAWPQTRVLSLNWGPWQAGMASEAVQARFREQGIEPIPLAAGARSFVQELACGPKSDVEVVIGAGPWADMESAGAESAPRPPLIRGELRMGSGGTLVLAHHFTLASDPYLADHMIDGRPVLPATAALEWMAEMVAAGWPGHPIAAVSDLKVLGGVVLDPDHGLRVELRARAATHAAADGQRISVEMADAERQRTLYRATVQLCERLPEAPQADAWQPAGEGMDVAIAYRDYLFHGPQFRRLQTVERLGPEGACGRLSSSDPAAWLGVDGAWLFDPALLDVGPQLAILWSRRQLEQTVLPSAIGMVRRYGRAPLPAQLNVELRLREQDGASLRYDVAFRDDEGRLRLQMQDVEGTASPELNRLASA